MNDAQHILVVHDDDLIGPAVVRLLEERGIEARELSGSARADELVEAAIGCRAVIAIGDRFVASPAVLGAAQMPGVRALVAVIFGNPDLMTLRKKGIPYTVLRTGVLLEQVVSALSDAIDQGRVILGAEDDEPVSAISADDVAACAVAAVDDESVCGRVLTLSAPDALKVSEIAPRVADATGRAVKISVWPRWALAAMRAVNRSPFKLPSGPTTVPPLPHSVHSLHPQPWRTVEAVAVDLARRNNHAMGMQ